MEASENFITIKKLSFPSAAEFYKARLEASGIECFILNSTSVMPIDSAPMGGILIKVKKEDKEMAIDIIKELDKDYLNVETSTEEAES